MIRICHGIFLVHTWFSIFCGFFTHTAISSFKHTAILDTNLPWQVLLGICRGNFLVHLLFIFNLLCFLHTRQIHHTKTRQFLIQICHAKFSYKFSSLIMANFSFLVHGKFSLQFMANLVYWSWKFWFSNHGNLVYMIFLPCQVSIWICHGNISVHGKFSFTWIPWQVLIWTCHGNFWYEPATAIFLFSYFIFKFLCLSHTREIPH